MPLGKVGGAMIIDGGAWMSAVTKRDSQTSLPLHRANRYRLPHVFGIASLILQSFAGYGGISEYLVISYYGINL